MMSFNHNFFVVNQWSQPCFGTISPVRWLPHSGHRDQQCLLITPWYWRTNHQREYQGIKFLNPPMPMSWVAPGSRRTGASWLRGVSSCHLHHSKLFLAGGIQFHRSECESQKPSGLCWAMGAWRWTYFSIDWTWGYHGVSPVIHKWWSSKYPQMIILTGKPASCMGYIMYRPDM